jgi:hypothetical protein
VFIRNIMIQLRQAHKRKAFIPILFVSASLVVALLLTSLATLRLDSIARSKSVVFSIDTDETPVALLGSGINLQSIMSANLISDASFEPYVFKSTLTVIGGDNQKIYVSNNEAKPGIYGKQFFKGAGARVYSYQDARMNLKKTALVTNYVPNQIGPFFASPIIGDFPWDAKVRGYAQKDDLMILVGDRGMVVSGADTQSPAIEYVGIRSDFAGACSNDEYFFACTTDGLVLSSPDGVNWQSWKSAENLPLNAIAASDKMVVSVSDFGVVLIGYDGVLYKRHLGTDDHIVDVIFDGRQFVALTDGGLIYTSSNGIYWNEFSSTPEKVYEKIKYADSLYAISHDHHSITITNNLVGRFPVRSTFTEGILSFTIISRSQILLLDGTGSLYESSDQGLSWVKTSTQPSNPVSGVYSFRSEKIICTSTFLDVYVALLVTELEMDSPLVTGEFQAGDICYLTIEHPNLPVELMDPTVIGPKRAWEYFGVGEAVISIREGAPSDGVGVMKLSLDPMMESGNEYMAISQPIQSDPFRKGLSPGDFYVFSIWLRKDALNDQTLKVWISGSFDPIGIEFRNIGTEWRKYTFKFSFPPGITQGQAETARINLAVGSPGVMYLDKAYLGEVGEMEKEIPQKYSRLLQTIKPPIVRLNFLKIGTAKVMPNRWALNRQLEHALNLVSETGVHAYPWLVFDTTVSESELRNIMEYLCGSISTPFGRIRLENGSSIPWISRFDRIYFEFTDQQQIFTSDSMKALHVNYLIDAIESTPYYPDAKNKILFIDGFDYREGIMLSRADYTASDLVCFMEDQKILSMEHAVREYISAVPRTPDRPGRLSTNLVRSILFTNTAIVPNTADYTVILLETLGMDSAASLLTMTSDQEINVQTPFMASMDIAGQATEGEIIPVLLTSGQAETVHVKGYAFRKDNDLTLVIASFETSPISVSIDIRESLKNAKMDKYDPSGLLIASSNLKESYRRMTILPGQVIVVRTAYVNEN